MLKKYFYVLAALLLVLSSSVVFAGENAVGRGLTDQAEILGAPSAAVSSIFSFTYPNQVQRYRFSCTASSYVIVGIGDRAIAGDHWVAHIKIQDRNPTGTGVEASGAATGYNYTYLYNFGVGAQPFRGLIEVRYLSGINTFPAGGELYVYCPGVVTLTPLAISDF